MKPPKPKVLKVWAVCCKSGEIHHRCPTGAEYWHFFSQKAHAEYEINSWLDCRRAGLPAFCGPHTIRLLKSK